MASATDRQQKSTRILQAAMHVFARKGFKSTALDEVAHQAGIAKGTLYLYFRDKQDLYFQAALQVLDDLEAHIERQVSQQAGPLDKLRSVARGQIGFFAHRQDSLRLFAAMLAPGMAGLHRRLMGVLRQRRQSLLQKLTTIMEEAKREGLVRGDIETRDLVLSYVGVVNEAMQSLLLPQLEAAGAGCPTAAAAPEESEAAARAEVIMKILIEGIAPVGSRGGDKP